MQEFERPRDTAPRSALAHSRLRLAALVLPVLFALPLQAVQAGTVGEQIEALLKDTERPAAPEFTGISAWVNTEGPLTMAALRGKVVLLDFWTYG